jgi:hypothetical protein
VVSRVCCEVPGCPNTSAKFVGQEYLCSRHYRLVPKKLKRRRAALARMLHRRERLTYEAGTYVTRDLKAGWLMYRVWQSMVKAAIERAAGL